MFVKNIFTDYASHQAREKATFPELVIKGDSTDLSLAKGLHGLAKRSSRLLTDDESPRRT